MSHPYLIIGQGIAGSLLAFELHKRKQKFFVVDDCHSNSASKVAAGLINPITGKKFTINDQFESQLDLAQKTYQDIEALLNTKFFHIKPMLRVIQNKEEESFWKIRQKDQNINALLDPSIEINSYKKNINIPHCAFVSNKSGYCDTNHFIVIFRKWLKKQKCLFEEKINYTDITLNNDKIIWKDKPFEKIIFAEGFQAALNPWFDWIPFCSAKGEILTIQTDKPTDDQIIYNFGKWLLPVDSTTFKTGSNYNWDDLTNTPTENGKKEIRNSVDKFLKIKYSTLKHEAGVRPIILDRSPIVGCHPRQEKMAILNGLGSRGVVVGPTLAKMLIENILDGKEIGRKVSVARYEKAISGKQ